MIVSIKRQQVDVRERPLCTLSWSFLDVLDNEESTKERWFVSSKRTASCHDSTIFADIQQSWLVLVVTVCVYAFFGANHLFRPVQRAIRRGRIRQCSWLPSSCPDYHPALDTANFENSSVWRGRRLRLALAEGFGSNMSWNVLINVAAYIQVSLLRVGAKIGASSKIAKEDGTDVSRRTPPIQRTPTPRMST
ncbi:hypothetical protein BDZ45DRAFT_135519 [Acephala macrosclerotiorum]|nr:hypothetical protein BDZ45DRAFT_135519 [Acephala macrosclerotiorum]